MDNMSNLMGEIKRKIKKPIEMNTLSNRTVQIVGSCSDDADLLVHEFSHELVRLLAINLLKNGSNLLGTVGVDVVGDKGLHLVYDWDIIESVYEYAKSLSFSEKTKNILKIVSSKKSESKIPEHRRKMWDKLISEGVISLNRIKSGQAWNAGAHQRQEQEKLSEALIILGGGEGAEHLYSLYISQGKPVIPLNIPIGSSYSDGISKKEAAGVFLYDKAVDNPNRFIPRSDENTASKLIELNYENWKDDPEAYVKKIIDFLKIYIKPQVFYVRLLNEDNDDYQLVEAFFRDVVDPVVKEKNYIIKDMGSSETQEAFLNIEIFKQINDSLIIIADLTDVRPNCCIETGFAFGLKKKVILTAKRGTNIPFDAEAIDCYFWNPDAETSLETKRKEFREFWEKTIDRSPIIPEIEVI